MRNECLAHGTHNPGGVRGEQRHAFGVVLRVLDDEFVPLFGGALGDTAQHRVNEACRARTDLFACQGHALVQRRVGGNAHVQQLVHAHAQHNQGGGADLLDRAVYAAAEDCVVGALVAQRAVGQLGCKACVAVVEAVATNRLGQHEVRVGVRFRHGAQYVEDGCACGVCGTRACGGCRRGEFAGGHGAAVAFVAALIALGGAAATAFGVVVLGLGAACGAFDAGQAVKAAAGTRFAAGVVVPLLRAALRALILRALVLSALGILGLLAVLLAHTRTRAVASAGAATTLTLRTALTLTAALIELTLTATLAELAVAGLAIASVAGLAVSSLVGALFVAHASTTRPSAMSLPAPRAHAGASIIFLPAG